MLIVLLSPDDCRMSGAGTTLSSQVTSQDLTFGATCDEHVGEVDGSDCRQETDGNLTECVPFLHNLIFVQTEQYT